MLIRLFIFEKDLDLWGPSYGGSRMPLWGGGAPSSQDPRLGRLVPQKDAAQGREVWGQPGPQLGTWPRWGQQPQRWPLFCAHFADEAAEAAWAPCGWAGSSLPGHSPANVPISSIASSQLFYRKNSAPNPSGCLSCLCLFFFLSVDHF